jgi:hypothetical protein
VPARFQARGQEDRTLTVLAVVIPVAVVGLIFWIVIGIKQRSAEPFTTASAAAFYAHLFVIVSATLAVIGGVLLVKVIVGFINLSYSYSGGFLSSTTSLCPAGAPASECSSSSQPDFAPQRTQDLVLALTLIVVGIVVVLVHRMIARAVSTSPGGRPAWVERGALIAFTVIYASGALFGVVAGGHGLISYFVVPSSSPSAFTGATTLNSVGQPFGDLLGAAICFVPAWIIALTALLRSQRPPRPPAAQGYVPVAS